VIPHDAEERFQAYLLKMEPYDAAIRAEGREPWHGGNVERRRELFFRRYR
jgi:hypothetical protein